LSCNSLDIGFPVDYYGAMGFVKNNKTIGHVFEASFPACNSLIKTGRPSRQGINRTSSIVFFHFPINGRKGLPFPCGCVSNRYFLCKSVSNNALSGLFVWFDLPDKSSGKACRSNSAFSESPRKACRSNSVLSESPRKACRSNSVLSESPRKACRSDSALSESPRKACRSNSAFSESPRKACRSDSEYSGSPRKASRRTASPGRFVHQNRETLIFQVKIPRFKHQINRKEGKK